MVRAALITLFLVLGVGAGRADAVEERLADPALEARALEISRSLRCLVCQNQSIADSNADLAQDLRRLVRERVAAGEANEQVIAFMVERYGDFVLLKPPVKPKTYALWFGPAVVFLLGAGALVFYLRRAPARPGREEAPLSEAERRRIEALLHDDGGSS